MMQATEFESHHQTLLHQLVVGIAALTYLIYRDDIVWRFVKNSANPHTLERFAFLVATFFIAVGAIACTWARALPGSSTRVQTRRLGELSYAVGLASLLPLLGFFLLIGGEALRILRLVPRDRDHVSNSRHPSPGNAPLPAATMGRDPTWSPAIRREIVKWGILLTMIVFVVTLQDRQADVLVGLSFLLGVLCNSRLFRATRQKQGVGLQTGSSVSGDRTN